MKVVMRTSTYQLHPEEPPRYTMFPVLKMHLLIQLPVTPCSTGTRQSHCRSVHRLLTYSSSEDDDDTPTDEIPSPDSSQHVQYHTDALQQPSSNCTLNAYVNLEEEEEEEEEEEKEEEEDFQTVPLDDEHWDTEEILDRHLCIHDHSILHELCLYPHLYLDYTSASYYDTLDLSDISEIEVLMTTSSNEDIPVLEEEIFGH